MKLLFSFGGKEFEASLSKGHDISIPIRAGAENVNAFHAGDPIIKPFEMGKFVGSVKKGSPVNTNDISFNPHGNGTHTECLGHITEEMQSLTDCIKDYLIPALLITVNPKAIGDDLVLTDEILSEAAEEIIPDALIIRTLPNRLEKKSRRYSGTNPPYLNAEAMLWIVKHGVKHLLLDLPSVDKEQDDGAVICHKIFWDIEGNQRRDCSITELIYVPDDLEDGHYVVNLQFAPFDNDASPSRPILFPVKEISK